MKFSELSKLAMPFLDQVFGDLGFTQDKRGIFRKMISDDCQISVGLLTAGRGYRDHFLVNPNISIREYAPELIYKQITNGLEINSVAGVAIGYIMPQKRYTEWDFCTDCDMSEVAENMRVAMVDYGMPYLNSMVDLANFVAMYRKYGFVERDYLIPIIYNMLGQYQESVTYMDEAIEYFKENSNIYFRYPNYIEYCDMLKEYYKKELSSL